MVQNTHQEYITKSKFKELTEELEQLKTVARKEIAEKLESARELGDLSENAEYHDAREKQSELEGKIAHIENILKNAKVVSGTSRSSTITVGSKVVLQKQGTRTETTYELVGSAEADMLAGKLSVDSPLGQALLGKKAGDKVTMDAPSGTITYTIKKLA